MDLNEAKIKEEVSSFVSSLQRLLPKKKEAARVEPLTRRRVPRLTDVHADAKGVFPRCFLGARLVVLREVLDRLRLVQHYHYGRSKDEHKCFPQMIHKEMTPRRSLADDGLTVDSGGSATATYTEVVGGGYVVRLTTAIRDLVASESEVAVERDGADSLGSLTLSVRDVEPGSLRVVTQWMYKLRPDLLVGAELGARPLGAPAAPDCSLSARYERPSFALSATVSRAAYQVCFYKKFSADLRLATVLHDGTRARETAVAVALHKTYSNGAELKVFVDSAHTGGFTFQRDVVLMEPGSEVRVLRLLASTLIDRQRRVRFGLGVNLDF